MASLVPLILAAGASSRMGTPKALLDLGGKTALQRILDACRDAALARPVVVLGHHVFEVPEAEVALNPAPSRGMTSSLQEGLRRLPADARGFLIFPVDHPLVTWRELVHLEEVFEKVPHHAVVIPTFEGRRGHPVACDLRIAEEILALGPDEPAHLVIRKDPGRVLEVPVGNPWVVRDLDTPEDLAEALKALASP